ncbi:sugar transferase [Streptococcus sp. S784/96/1]|uniref:sugar transferase n=1 Tax=Streptococcus sp. S784/96/1 TaxID=2653499 RepID=UPI00138709CE|nr:sugar transferase [Streptococcus sp. S784/96/1]
MRQEKEEWQKMTVLLADIFPVIISGYITTLIPSTDLHLESLPILVLAHFVSYFLSSFYNSFNERGHFEGLRITFKYSTILLIVTATLSFLLKYRFVISRRGLIFFISLNLVLVYLLNSVIKKYRNTIYPTTASSHKIYMLTTASRFEKIMASQNNNLAKFEGTVVAVTIVDNPEIELESHIHNVPIAIMEEYITKSVVDQVFIDIPSEILEIKDILLVAERVGIPASINIDSLNSNVVGDKKFENILGHEVVTVSTHFNSYSHLLMKRALDIVGSSVGLFICGVVAIVIVPLIRRDGGPAIFSQNRVGKNGRIFKFYKFRSMHVNAEAMKKELMKNNEMEGLMFKMDSDPRITSIGRFIRKTSIDELPQFWNVLIGDMSLVGTRPPTVDEYNQYTLEQKRRLSFKPGITGLWQVSGRSDIKDFDEIVKLDVAYINNWTIWSDIKILLKTILVVFKMQGSK